MLVRSAMCTTEKQRCPRFINFRSIIPVQNVIGLILAYALGSVSFPGIYARIRGIDLRRKGEGHLGATSIYTATGSPALFLFLGLLDAAKGLVAYWFLGVPGLIAAMLGHMFPIFFSWRGGNAVSVYYGGIFAVSPALVLACALSELIVSRTIRTRWRHAIYMVVRAIPAAVYPEMVPAYALLLARHAWFYYVKFRQGNF